VIPTATMKEGESGHRGDVSADDCSCAKSERDHETGKRRVGVAVGANRIGKFEHWEGYKTGYVLLVARDAVEGGWAQEDATEERSYMDHANDDD
jgi:hypothetical protein